VPEDRERLRVGLDAHVIGRRRTGNEAYARGLALALAARPDVDLTLYLDPDVEWPGGGTGATPRLKRLRAARPEPRIAFELPIRASMDRLDVLHVQYVAPPLSTVPVATTVHDMSFLDAPEMMSAPLRWRLRATVALSVRRSGVVITPSAFSRARLLHHYDIRPERVVVAAPVVMPRFAHRAPAEVLEALRLPNRFVLAVGDLLPRKNLPRLLEGVDRARRGGLDAGLVVAGQRAEGADELQLAIARHDAADWVRLLGYVDEDNLAALYKSATLVAYVSLYEGFGIPVIESMAAGTPVVASAVTAIPEVAGDAALLIDPTDPAAISAALISVANDEGLRDRLIAAGRRRAAAFLPDAVISATIHAYRIACGAEVS
jgi:glycosyltransferase involved in cell wall biosynthesis